MAAFGGVNLPVAFGCLLVGGILLQHGMKATGAAFAGGDSTQAAVPGAPRVSPSAPVVTGRNYNIRELVALAESVGFTGHNAAIAAAVAMAESSGNPRNVSPNSGGIKPDYGLWQINGTYNADTLPRNWSDPYANAQAAYRIWRARGWRDWVTFTTGRYLQYMPAAERAARGG